MSNQVLYGKTSEKNIYVKIEEIPSAKLNDVFPNITTEDAKEFSPNWQLEDDHYFYVDLSTNYSIIEPYEDVLKSSGSHNDITKSQFSKLDGIFIGNKIADDVYNIKFQRIWGRYYFKNPLISFKSECEFSSNQDIIMLNSKTDAYYEGNTKKLYFKNFNHITKLFNGIVAFYREAQQEDINNFKQLELLNVEIDDNQIGQKAGRKIAYLLDKEVLKNKTVDQLQEYAKKYKEDLQLDTEQKIIIKKVKDVNLLYKVANELFFTSELTNEKRETNSATKIK